MILGDSLYVMASLAEREGLRGKVQCIYVDPPYGIKFNSNFQWSTTNRDVKDGSVDHITREPEQVKAFRDTWRDGIHSYLTYLRDRLALSRDLLADSGSIFVQIGDENVHRVRDLMDEIFGSENFISLISFSKNSGFGATLLATANDYLVWYARDKARTKYRQLYKGKSLDSGGSAYSHVVLPNGAERPASREERLNPSLIPTDARLFMLDNITKPGPGSRFDIEFEGHKYRPEPRWWGTTPEGMQALIKANRVHGNGKSLAYVRFLDDFPAAPLSNVWNDTMGQNQFGGPKIYVVQTALTVVERCILMATDPGDLVLDPTCGSGTTAYVSEQWGRRWITIDTSRVALALARARIMGARYPYYLLADSREGRKRRLDTVLTQGG
jgi:adenine-specific DNA-methyltransferase